MLQAGPAQRVTIYVDESHRYRGRNAYLALFDFLYQRQVSGATVTRGIAGFGADHQIHTSEVLIASGHLPIKIEFVETAAKVAEILPQLRGMIGDGMIAVTPTEVYLALPAGQDR